MLLKKKIVALMIVKKMTNINIYIMHDVIQVVQKEQKIIALYVMN